MRLATSPHAIAYPGKRGDVLPLWWYCEKWMLRATLKLTFVLGERSAHSVRLPGRTLN